MKLNSTHLVWLIILPACLISLAAGLFLYDRYVLSHWYQLEIEGYQIEILADNCETCFIDWPIDRTIWITEPISKKQAVFELYSEGPDLELGIDAANTQLVIHAPGFSSLFIDLDLLELAPVPESVSMRGSLPASVIINWHINAQHQLQKGILTRHWYQQ